RAAGDRPVQDGAGTSPDVVDGEAALGEAGDADGLGQGPLPARRAVEEVGLVEVDVGVDEAGHDEAAVEGEGPGGGQMAEVIVDADDPTAAHGEVGEAGPPGHGAATEQEIDELGRVCDHGGRISGGRVPGTSRQPRPPTLSPSTQALSGARGPSAWTATP